MKETGLEEYMGRIFNKHFMKCLDFTPERILFHLFDDLEITTKKKEKKKEYFCTILFIAREQKRKELLLMFRTVFKHHRVSFLLSVLSFPNG